MSDDKRSDTQADAGSSQRPHATLDLKAERIEGGATAGPQAEDAQANETSTSQPETSSPGNDNSPAPAREGGGAGLLTHLAAGLMGGLIALVVGYYALGNFRDRLPFVSDTSAEQIKSTQESLQQGISALAERNTEARAELADRIAALDARTEGLAQTDNQAVQSLTARVEALEQQVEAAAETPDESASAERMASVSDRLGKLEETVASLRRSLEQVRAQSAENVTAVRASAMAVAISSLRRTVDRGDAYAAELKALRELASETLQVDTLAAASETGVPTLRALRQSFPQYANQALDAAGASGDDSLIGQIVESARSVVNVRPVGEIEGDTPSAIIARVENRLKAGDLPGVLAQAEQLPAPAATELSPWTQQVRTRVNAEKELDALETRLLAAANQ